MVAIKYYFVQQPPAIFPFIDFFIENAKGLEIENESDVGRRKRLALIDFIANLSVDSRLHRKFILICRAAPYKLKI